MTVGDGDLPVRRQIGFRAQSGEFVCTAIDQTDRQIEFLSRHNRAVGNDDVQNQAGCQTRGFLEIRFLILQQELNVLVSGLRLDLPQKSQCSSQIRNDGAGLDQI